MSSAKKKVNSNENKDGLPVLRIDEFFNLWRLECIIRSEWPLCGKKMERITRRNSPFPDKMWDICKNKRDIQNVLFGPTEYANSQCEKVLRDISYRDWNITAVLVRLDQFHDLEVEINLLRLQPHTDLLKRVYPLAIRHFRIGLKDPRARAYANQCLK